jgi:hypothetical protein
MSQLWVEHEWNAKSENNKRVMGRERRVNVREVTKSAGRER